MPNRTVTIRDIRVGEGQPLFLIAGPCVIESRDLCLRIAEAMKKTCGGLGVPYIFKASFDKANRTSAASFRGPGLEAGLKILEEVRRRFDVPILSDVHLPDQCAPAAQVLDVLQVPAFLCRQTDLVIAAAKAGKPVNYKKAQFMAPEDMGNVCAKARAAGNDRILLTDRGTMFGYHRLVNDMRGIPRMQALGCPVVFDATHSVQEPGGKGDSSGGEREMVLPLALAAVAAGADGLFLEVHPKPDKALSDAASMLPLSAVEDLLGKAVRIRNIVTGE
jgi:2-dehydro-3-deoxyphosphooctonate aldolase (KDO 8-P synthase)